MSANSQQLKGHRVCAASVYGFSAGEMRKIAHNLHTKAKEEVASGRARKFRGSIPIRAHLLPGWVGDRPVHVVAASAPAERIVITVYEPDLARWEPGFKKRKP